MARNPTRFKRTWSHVKGYRMGSASVRWHSRAGHAVAPHKRRVKKLRKK